ncbi:MAG: hypothetical protein ACRD2H_03490 [Terriglobales bacterium]
MLDQLGVSMATRMARMRHSSPEMVMRYSFPVLSNAGMLPSAAAAYCCNLAASTTVGSDAQVPEPVA